MRYAMFMIADVFGTQAAHDMPSAQMIDKMTAYSAGLAGAGVRRTVDDRHPPSSGVRLHFEQSGAQTRDVPVRGVDSSAIAYAWAQCCSALPGDIVELRKIEEPDDLHYTASGSQL
jgi:hypothetical protein